ncbi:zinc ABC transporter substrate-binding protein [Halorubrum sp. BOL3-1]|nr:zinc ABC transporter substrate-binding protein [Halorubrum sp. BOL3-1]
MAQYTRRRLVTTGIGFTAISALAGCTSNDADTGDSTGDGLGAQSSFFVFGDFATHVAGDAATAETLVPVGQHGHGWEPGPDIQGNILESDLFVCGTDGFQPWVGDLITSLRDDEADVEIVSVGEGVDLIEGVTTTGAKTVTRANTTTTTNTRTTTTTTREKAGLRGSTLDCTISKRDRTAIRSGKGRIRRCHSRCSRLTKAAITGSNTSKKQRGNSTQVITRHIPWSKTRIHSRPRKIASTSWSSRTPARRTLASISTPRVTTCCLASTFRPSLLQHSPIAVGLLLSLRRARRLVDMTTRTNTTTKVRTNTKTNTTTERWIRTSGSIPSGPPKRSGLLKRRSPRWTAKTPRCTPTTRPLTATSSRNSTARSSR